MKALRQRRPPSKPFCCTPCSELAQTRSVLVTAQPSWPRAAINSLRTFADDVTRGFFDITHNGLAVLGMVELTSQTLHY